MSAISVFARWTGDAQIVSEEQGLSVVVKRQASSAGSPGLGKRARSK